MGLRARSEPPARTYEQSMPLITPITLSHGITRSAIPRRHSASLTRRSSAAAAAALLAFSRRATSSAARLVASQPLLPPPASAPRARLSASDARPSEKTEPPTSSSPWPPAACEAAATLRSAAWGRGVARRVKALQHLTSDQWLHCATRPAAGRCGPDRCLPHRGLIGRTTSLAATPPFPLPSAVSILSAPRSPRFHDRTPTHIKPHLVERLHQPLPASCAGLGSARRPACGLLGPRLVPQRLDLLLQEGTAAAHATPSRKPIPRRCPRTVCRSIFLRQPPQPLLLS
jgi:hypothetical protein